MKHTIKQIESEIKAVEECLNKLQWLEVGDKVYMSILKGLRMLDCRLDELTEEEETKRKWKSSPSYLAVDSNVSFRDQCNSDRFDLAEECDDEIQRAEIRAGA